MAYGKVLNLFLVNSNPDSLILATMSNWNVTATKIPRIEVSSYDRDEIRQPGIYFLICIDQENVEKSVYIGESENVYDRLKEHIQDYKSEKEKFYWITAICFTGSTLNKTLVRYLENRSVNIAKEINRYNVLTKQTYVNTAISEQDTAAMEEFLDNMKIVLGTLGCEALEPLNRNDSNEMNDRRFFVNIGHVIAEGEAAPDGFVVFKGAKINEKTNTKALNKGTAVMREALINSDKIVNYTTTEDILFTSPSAAADFVLGYGVSGPATWKDKNGVALKDRSDL